MAEYAAANESTRTEREAKPDGDKAELEGEALARKKEARLWKSRFALDFKECYFFATPTRMREVMSDTPPARMYENDQGDLQTSSGILYAQDFVTETVNTFMPEAQKWCARGRGMFVTKEDWESVRARVIVEDEIIFAAMKASNLYPELQKSFYPDLAIGTYGLWIHRRTLSEPISVQAIPLRELEINLGPDGYVDDRFVVRHTRNRYVRTLLPDVMLPKECAEEIEAKPDDQTCVWWGFWRKWDRKDTEVWQSVTFVDKKMVASRLYIGVGACPLIVGRFNATADWPWGMGPLMMALPELRQVDELEAQRTMHNELQLTPPITFPDESFAAVEQGLEAGCAYPVRPGMEKSVQRIYEPGPADVGTYEAQEKEHKLRKIFFIDYPEQRGDTPPTLGQWLDEMARAQRRMGGPGSGFWWEGPCKIFARFQFLLETAGVIQPLTANGRAVGVLPYNPATRAAEQQEVATNVQAIQILSQAFPEEFKIRVDGFETMKSLLAKMRADLIKFRDEDGVKQALNQITQLIGAKLGAPGAAEAQPGVAP